MIKQVINRIDNLLQKTVKFDFFPLLCIRLYLLPVIFEGAHSKVTGFSSTVAWFRAPVDQGGLGLPFPELLALMTTSTEVLGLICIALGLFTRLITIPLIVVMCVASLLVHLSHGWLAIAHKNSEAAHRLDDFLSWMSINYPGRYNYITELGDPVMLNNGLEFSATYFIMLLVLLCYGGGKYISADYWLKKYLWQPNKI